MTTALPSSLPRKHAFRTHWPERVPCLSSAAREAGKKHLETGVGDHVWLRTTDSFSGAAKTQEGQRGG